MMENNDPLADYYKMYIEHVLDLADHANDPYAQFFYGMHLIRNSLDDDQDSIECGLEYIERSAANGCVDAEYWLAQRYLDPYDTPPDSELRQRGIDFLQSATLKGHFGAAVSLGYMHFHERKPQNSEMATDIWKTAIAKRNETEKRRTSLFFMHGLSTLFSYGAYGHLPKWDTSGRLHILSQNSLIEDSKIKDILLVLSELTLDKPDLFKRMTKAGLTWPQPHEMTELISDTHPHKDSKIKNKGTSVCQKLFFVSKIPDIKYDLTAYLKRELPPEITNIPNLTFGLDD